MKADDFIPAEVEDLQVGVEGEVCVVDLLHVVVGEIYRQLLLAKSSLKLIKTLPRYLRLLWSPAGRVRRPRQLQFAEES